MVLAHNIEDRNRTEDVEISQNVTFDSMLLAPDTLEGLRNSGFYRPSPIQLHGIPLGKCGFDLLLEAKSGTGKTAVFSVIALEQIDLEKDLQVVIIAPTREIAAQICDVIKQIGSSYKGLTVEVVMGGLPVREDIAKFKNNKVHIVVGSPGRLRHLIQDKHVDISCIRLLVLDEADKLMEKSFLKDINFIFSVLPSQKQVIMSSATYPENTRYFINQYVQTAQHVCPDSNSILLGIKQKITVVKHNSNIVTQTKYKFEELLQILSKNPFKQCLIFCNYQARVVELHKMLTKQKWPAEQLYGQQDQLDRLGALKSLQEYKCRILISTDLAARGIDASNIDLVINFEPPFEWPTYLHRIGRAGRFGSYGIAITILSEGNEEKNFTEILKTIKAPINLVKLDEDGGIHNGIHDTKSNSNTSDTLNVNDTVLEKSVEKYMNVWNQLTCDLNQNTDEIESFSSLCQSFKNNEIYSFADLMNSLEDHKDKADYKKNTECSYCQLRIKPIHVTDYLSSIKDKTKQKNLVYKKVECNAQNSNCEIKLGKNQNRLKNIQIDKYCTEEISCSDIGKPQTIAPSKYKRANIDEELLRAELPVAFGSIKKKINANNSIKHSKNKNKAQKELSGTHHERPDIDDKFLSEKLPTDFDNMKIKSKPEYPLKHPPNNAIYEKESVDCIKSINRNHSESNKWQREINYAMISPGSKKTRKSNMNPPLYENSKKVNNFNYEPHYHKYKRQYTDEIRNRRKQKHSDDGAYWSYINWYNQLKFNVKQLEFTIYMDEMSKL